MNLKTDLQQDLQAVQRIEQSLIHVNNHLKSITENVHAVELRLESYNSTLKVNTASLEEHIRRTEAAEKALVELEKKADAAVKAVLTTTEAKLQVVDGRLFTLLSAIVISLIGAIVAFTLRH